MVLYYQQPPPGHFAYRTRKQPVRFRGRDLSKQARLAREGLGRVEWKESRYEVQALGTTRLGLSPPYLSSSCLPLAKRDGGEGRGTESGPMMRRKCRWTAAWLKGTRYLVGTLRALPGAKTGFPSMQAAMEGGPASGSAGYMCLY